MLEFLFFRSFDKLEINDPDYNRGYTVYYKKSPQQTNKKPVLIIYSYISRAYGLNLDEKTSIVTRLLDEGVDVYILDWGNDSFFSCQTDWSTKNYIDKIDIVVQKIKSIHSVDSINAFSICAGTILTLLYLYNHPNNIEKIFFNDLILFFQRDGESKTSLIWLSYLKKMFPYLKLFPEFNMHLVTLYFIMNSTTNSMIAYNNNMIVEESGWMEFYKMLVWAIDQRYVPTKFWFEILDFVEAIISEGEEKQTEYFKTTFDLNPNLKIYNLVAQNDYIVKPSASTLIYGDDKIISSVIYDQEIVESGHFMYARKCSDYTEKFKTKAIKWLSE